jgi:hypothetical protein
METRFYFINLPGEYVICFLISLEYDQDFKLIRTIKLPMPIWDGWGLSKNWETPNVFYVSDGSNFIYECDVLNNFEILKKHTVR